MSVSSRRLLCGLLTQRPRWGLSMRGWLFLAALIVGTAATIFHTIYPFLAITARVPTELLAVEGWINDYAIRAARDEFNSGGYQRVVATGGPVHGISGYINAYSTAASIGAHRLKREGIPAALVEMAPSRTSTRDRTFSSAVALRDWFHAHQIPVQAINIVTEDVHARRTRLLFQRAFGPGVTVGVIAVPNPDYNAARWWRYSEGVRDVLGETISYLYAQFFFFPAVPAPADPTTPSVS